jgi:hypothetical protein
MNYKSFAAETVQSVAYWRGSLKYWIGSEKYWAKRVVSDPVHAPELVRARQGRMNALRSLRDNYRQLRATITLR